MATLSKKELEKALVALEEALTECNQLSTETKTFKLIRDATIQRFEFCVELAWKVSMKNLGFPVTNPKSALREMLRSGLISDFDLWFDFIDARNKSSHSYDDDIAAEVFSFIPKFVSSAKDLVSKL